jgi:hypothetical protein
MIVHLCIKPGLTEAHFLGTSSSRERVGSCADSKADSELLVLPTGSHSIAIKRIFFLISGIRKHKSQLKLPQKSICASREHPGAKLVPV